MEAIRMSENQPNDTLSRRKALKILAGSVGATLSYPLLPGAAVGEEAQGTAPSASYVPRFFNDQQMRSLDALSEMIIPADEHSAGARAARVNEYIDEIISRASKTRQVLWTNGLAAIDKMAEGDCGEKFADCTPEQQLSLMQTISNHEGRPTALEERFFAVLKRSTVDGYYTSEIGIHQDLQYQGNTYLADFPGCKRPRA